MFVVLLLTSDHFYAQTFSLPSEKLIFSLIGVTESRSCLTIENLFVHPCKYFCLLVALRKTKPEISFFFPLIKEKRIKKKKNSLMTSLIQYLPGPELNFSGFCRQLPTVQRHEEL